MKRLGQLLNIPGTIKVIIKPMVQILSFSYGSHALAQARGCTKEQNVWTLIMNIQLDSKMVTNVV